MGTSSSIYWCKKAGGIISIEKTHDAVRVKPNDLEGQANETKQSLIIYKIQAHAHGDKLPKLLQSSRVLPSENEHGKRPVYTGCMVNRSSDSQWLLPLSFRSQTRHKRGKGRHKTVQERDFQKRQTKISAHWTRTALGTPHRVAVYSFPHPRSCWRNRLSEHEAGTDHGITEEAILRHQTRQVWLFNQRKAKAENRHDCPL